MCGEPKNFQATKIFFDLVKQDSQTYEAITETERSSSKPFNWNIDELRLSNIAKYLGTSCLARDTKWSIAGFGIIETCQEFN